MSKQLNIALYQAKIGERIHSGWGLANLSSNNTYNVNTIIHGNQVNGNNNSINAESKDKKTMKLSNNLGSPSTKRYKQNNIENALYGPHIENKSKRACPLLSRRAPYILFKSRDLKGDMTVPNYRSSHININSVFVRCQPCTT